ncbi:hypothetical protein [Paenibacillus sp. FSL R7-0273]|uniref:hypothetical protein n=1 Tax=Paenibacillus sp. FSL R7-0273 TaxID=1536772 RepID=UPI00069441EF|nr:hypothetical protein [Paenibacillus sp. FSL R7-0273]OMF95115.1 hypothetical protein BK144_06155 [Paenibacillus sp. FSL R7-0273]
MPVQITITGENAKEALQEIGGLAAALVGAAPVTDKQKAKAQAATKPAETKQEEPEKTQAETKPQTKLDEGSGGEDLPTATELKAKATEVTKSGKREEVKALLTEFGYKALSDVAEADRAVFMERLEQL